MDNKYYLLSVKRTVTPDMNNSYVYVDENADMSTRVKSPPYSSKRKLWGDVPLKLNIFNKFGEKLRGILP